MPEPTNHPLSTEDKNKLNKAKTKFFQTDLGFGISYGTSTLELMASPLKQGIGYVILIIICSIILREIKLLRFIIRLDHLYIYVIIVLIFFVYKYNAQKKLNANIIYISTKLGRIPTNYELEQRKITKNTILSDLWRIIIGHLILDFILFNFTKPEWLNKDSKNYLHSFKKHKH